MEWQTLVDYVADEDSAGTSLKAYTDLWFENTGTDDYGFSALPAGYFSGADFHVVGKHGAWWTATDYSSTDATTEEWTIMTPTCIRVRQQEDRALTKVCPGFSVTGDRKRGVKQRLRKATSTNSEKAMSTKHCSTLLSLIFLLGLASCDNSGASPEDGGTSSSGVATCVNTYGTNTVTDCRDGHTYRTVVIGTQTWMAENLAYLPSVNAKADSSYTVAKYYVYNYDDTDTATARASTYYSTYGVLYN